MRIQINIGCQKTKASRSRMTSSTIADARGGETRRTVTTTTITTTGRTEMERNATPRSISSAASQRAPMRSIIDRRLSARSIPPSSRKTLSPASRTGPSFSPTSSNTSSVPHAASCYKIRRHSFAATPSVSSVPSRPTTTRSCTVRPFLFPPNL